MQSKRQKTATQLNSNKLGITFTNKEIVLELKNCSIEAYPYNHWTLDNPKFILLVESPSFERDYDLKYLGGIGNVSHKKVFFHFAKSLYYISSQIVLGQ
jgi:hypothetical protein